MYRIINIFKSYISLFMKIDEKIVSRKCSDVEYSNVFECQLLFCSMIYIYTYIYVYIYATDFMVPV